MGSITKDGPRVNQRPRCAVGGTRGDGSIPSAPTSEHSSARESAGVWREVDPFPMGKGTVPERVTRRSRVRVPLLRLGQRPPGPTREIVWTQRQSPAHTQCAQLAEPVRRNRKSGSVRRVFSAHVHGGPSQPSCRAPDWMALCWRHAKNSECTTMLRVQFLTGA